MTARAFTVASLAAAWECSEGVIRKLIVAGRLRSFRIGTLIRIPADEVERFECQNTASSDCSADMPSSGGTPTETATERVYPRPIASGRKRRPDNDGGLATVVPGPWAA